MYCEFFGLAAPPFNNTPDPRFFFNTPDHEEALASLIYAAEQRKGFLLVTGDVGSGKTLLSRLLLNRLGASVRTAVVTNTQLDGRELLLAICREYELAVHPAASTTEVFHALESFLLEQYARDRVAVVVLDEAQNLPAEAYEQLRLLGNLEADDAKLLQVLILGQPELQDVFRRPELSQLRQRIFRTFHLRALDRDVTGAYIRHRLAVAGCPEDRTLFDEKAVDAVYRHSEGVPRLINQICDNALLAAYTQSAQGVTAKLVADVVDQMMTLHAPSAPRKPTGNVARQLLGMTTPAAYGDSPGRAATERDESHLASLTARWARCEDAINERMQEMERLMRGMSDRVAAAETTVDQIKLEHQRADDRSRESAGELNLLRRTREEALALVQQMNAAARDSRELRDQARSAAEELQRQTDSAARKHARQQEIVQRQVRQALQELHAYTRTQKLNLSKTLAEEKAGFQNVRQLRERAQAVLDEALATAEEVKANAATVQKAAANVGRLNDDWLRERVVAAASEEWVRETILAPAAADFGDRAFDALRDRLSESRREADRLKLELAEAVVAARGEMARMTERASQDRQSLDEAVTVARSELERLSERASQDRQSLGEVVESSRRLLETTHQQTKSLRDESRVIAGELAARLEKARTALQRTIAEAAETSNDLRQQTRSASAELRDGLSQMLARAATLKRDLVVLGDRVSQRARAAAENLEERSVAAMSQLESLRQTAGREAAAGAERLAAIQQQAEASVRQTRESAGTLLERSQAHAAALAQQANEIYIQAQVCASEAQARADKLIAAAREETEKWLSKADAAGRRAAELSKQSHVESEQIREQLAMARLKLIEGRDDASKTLKSLARLHEETREKTEALIRHGEEVKAQTHALLAVPRELIAESTQRAGALAQMARKTGAIVEHLERKSGEIMERLGQTAESVERRRREIDEAAALADDKLEVLRCQTARVGQLVGIVRQLYGAMDARSKIERVRSRLDQADDLCRAVLPRELDNLRTVLSDTLSGSAGHPASNATAAPVSVIAKTNRRSPPAPTEDASRKSSTAVARPSNPSMVRPAGAPKGSLGEIVTRNKKLNEWLRETLGGIESGSRSAAEAAPASSDRQAAQPSQSA